MDYVNKIKYEIVPNDTFKIIRGCAGCGCKQIFSSTGNFRVNANGNRLDVWLIYSCDKCRHTYNLPILERVNAEKIPRIEYQAFLANDKKIAFKYGTDKSIFTKNRAEIAWNSEQYTVIPIDSKLIDIENDFAEFTIYNKYNIPVREDKILSDILSISRSKIKKLLKDGQVVVNIIKNKNLSDK